MIKTFLATAIIGGLGLHSAAFAQAAGGDADITARVVHEILVADPDVARLVKVSTDNGVVTLEGTVLTATQFTKVLQDTRAVPGVASVKNRLVIIM